MNPNILPSDRFRLMGVIDPDAYAANTYTTGWIAAADCASFLAVVKVGTMASSSTVNAKLEQATDGDGSVVADIAGKAITQLTEAGADSDKQALINLRPDELDVANGFTHFRLSVTVADAASDMDGEVWGVDARYEPEDDKASVDEIVS